jgi:hypothetical protein
MKILASMACSRVLRHPVSRLLSNETSNDVLQARLANSRLKLSNRRTLARA